eukprot:GHRR01001615.1.p1 GENE.GHRR01001615.1~~GHRR01001615.1.p1  ORF type:complete len:299 (+),score=67.87 GHRR01001615.1:181-1077(+)
MLSLPALQWRVLPAHKQRTAFSACTAKAVRATEGDSLVAFLQDHGITRPVVCATRTTCTQLTVERVQALLELLEEQGLQPADVDSMLVKCVTLLSCSPSNAAAIIEFLLDLGLSREQVANTIRRFPHITAYGVKSHLVPHSHYLKSLGLSNEELKQLVVLRPHVLGASIELVITYLTKWLRIKRTHVGRLLFSYPLDYSLPKLVFPSELAAAEESTDADISDLTAVAEQEADTSTEEISNPGQPQAAAAGQQLQQPWWKQQPAWGSPERCTWLDYKLGEDQSSGGDSSNSAERDNNAQ